MGANASQAHAGGRPGPTTMPEVFQAVVENVRQSHAEFQQQATRLQQQHRLHGSGPLLHARSSQFARRGSAGQGRLQLQLRAFSAYTPVVDGDGSDPFEGTQVRLPALLVAKLVNENPDGEHFYRLRTQEDCFAFVGVKDYNSPLEDTCVLPFPMMEQLGLSDGGSVELTLVNATATQHEALIPLPIASHLRLRWERAEQYDAARALPDSEAFELQAALEKAVDEDYPVIMLNDVVRFHYGGATMDLRVTGLRKRPPLPSARQQRTDPNDEEAQIRRAIAESLQEATAADPVEPGEPVRMRVPQEHAFERQLEVEPPLGWRAPPPFPDAMWDEERRMYYPAGWDWDEAAGTYVAPQAAVPVAAPSPQAVRSRPREGGSGVGRDGRAAVVANVPPTFGPGVGQALGGGSTSSKAVRVYRGFTEHTYRLVFPFEDKFAPNTPLLLTIVPSGVVENNKVLQPQAEKGLIAFTYPQSISDELAVLPVEQQPDANVPGSILHGKNRTLRDTAFVWRRKDGTNALVQTWATNINEKFRQDFDISKGVNPDPAKFLPQAVSEFQEAMVRLFGPAATSCPVWFCHKKLESTSPAVVGFGEEVLAHLRGNPELMRELAIASIDNDGLGFVADGTNGKGEQFEKRFRLTPGEQCVVYRKTGWDTMGSIKPLHQFLLDAEFHEPGAERDAAIKVKDPERGLAPSDPTALSKEELRRKRIQAMERRTSGPSGSTPTGASLPRPASGGTASQRSSTSRGAVGVRQGMQDLEVRTINVGGKQGWEARRDISVEVHEGVVRRHFDKFAADSWACTWSILYGSVLLEQDGQTNTDATVPKATVRVQALWEPPQHKADAEYTGNGQGLGRPPQLLQSPAVSARVEAAVAAAGLRRVGWLFTCPPRTSDFTLRAEEVLRAAYLQLEAADGYAGGEPPFVTLRMSVESQASSSTLGSKAETPGCELTAWCATAQAMELRAKGALETAGPATHHDAIRVAEGFRVLQEGRPVDHVDISFLHRPLPMSGSFGHATSTELLDLAAVASTAREGAQLELEEEQQQVTRWAPPELRKPTSAFLGQGARLGGSGLGGSRLVPDAGPPEVVSI